MAKHRDQLVEYAMKRRSQLQNVISGNNLKDLAKYVIDKDNREIIVDSMRSNMPKKEKKILESKEEFIKRKEKEIGIYR